MTRSMAAQRLALELGAASAGGDQDLPPGKLDAAILFAPVGTLVPVALAALDRGGTLAVAGIHLTDIPALNYEKHLFEERTLRSVTANTRADGRAYLAAAQAHPPSVHLQEYPLDEADRALADLAGDRVDGVAVLDSLGRARPGRPPWSARRSTPRRTGRPRARRPARPIRAARAGSASSVLSAAARSATNRSGSSGVPVPSVACSIGTSRPVTPSATTSGMPPVAVATTAVSQAIASRLTMPIGS